ncbi:response regulator transcription factor [Desulfoferula mesophila]|uniref:HTH luxR-type domain-containing protein n=1 Tax=Desulfoferula mesophila TaxID=3058419 RepID=A0AAU9EJ35_9BACT|nr:hypothetical protein FAK_30760 [Desulfoferula mesophilus]
MNLVMKNREDTSQRNLKVHVAGGQRLTNKLVCGLLSANEGMIPSEGPLDDLPLLIDGGEDQKPDVVLLDYFTPEVQERLHEDGLNLLVSLKGTPTIVFNFGQETHSKKWIVNGVRGVVYAEEKPEIIVKAVMVVSMGHMWFPREAMSKCLSNSWDDKPKQKREEGDLTNREKEVLSLAAEGFSNAAIADKLFISAYTVKVHMQNIYRKIGVPNRVTASIWARKHLDLEA